jgi:lipoate-protein ligase A
VRRETVHLRVIRDEPGPAAWNMGADEALLVHAEPPTLRLYGWRPHAVSLGWFQRFADFADVPATVPIVRRPTGGGAIWHGDELTFALAIDAALLPRDVAAGYRVVHDAAVQALATVGVACERSTAGMPPAARPDGRWCFREAGRDDVVTGHGKLLGSAQRRLTTDRPRLLHHGSLVLERPTATPFVAAVADTAPVTPALRATLADALVANVAAALGLTPVAGDYTPGERQATAAFAARHADPSHVQRR